MVSVIIIRGLRCHKPHDSQSSKLQRKLKAQRLRVKMAASVMASVSLKPSPFTVEKSAVRGLPSLARTSSSFKVQASGGKKIKTDTPYGTGGGMNLKDGKDASGRKPTVINWSLLLLICYDFCI
ncbi:PREDICTED: photosystem II [Prunus dulcis]|uniref:Photosystem II 10 kDa polypeptide, chloroplastic n=1 Tax=Prunus dulcis TaxID=3755 RepID=A0A5E4G4F6_PRUDU|nr:PREDICTED: photosystem II [Prunus dulcis]